jgi:putative oxidoreductase
MNSVNDVLFRSYSVDVGLLVFRLFFGVTMALAHGLPKLQRFAEIHATFPDPLGIGSSASLGMAIFAEIACAFGVATGFLFRLALVPLVITMFVAAFIIHGQDPFQKQELALAYLAAYVALLFSGPGRFSLDSFMRR